MNNVVELLVKLGSSAKLQASNQSSINAINEAHLDPQVKQALKDRDFESLETLLNTKFKIHCALFPAKDDDEEPNQDDQDNDDSEQTEEKAKFIASA